MRIGNYFLQPFTKIMHFLLRKSKSHCQQGLETFFSVQSRPSVDPPLGVKPLDWQQLCEEWNTGIYKSITALSGFTCYLRLSQHRSGASIWVLCNPQTKQKIERDKKQGRPQISFPQAPEVTNLTQNSRKQLLIEQDGEEQGENCSLLKCSSSRTWGALEQHSHT